MEESLTECLIRVREDLNKLKKGRDYLDTILEENTNFTRRPMEPIASILAVSSSQNTPEIDAVETFLDNFHLLLSSNNDPDVWRTFNHELGIICVKVLSAIERTDRFQVMFSKLLTIINEISEKNSDVWKAVARQILNVFINKKLSTGYLETMLKKYIVILENIDHFVLYDFCVRNLTLLKSLSMLVQGVGDFETQFAIMKVVFLHLVNNRKLMANFFGTSEKDKALFQSLTFTDFEEDCRSYLNALNKPGGGLERKIYSISCQILYLGGCLVEPITGRKLIWVDANKETERVSFKCSLSDSEDQRVIYLKFPEITHVQIESEKMEGNCCVTIRTKKLRHLPCNKKNDDICLVAENRREISEFVSFLEVMIKKKKGKFSKTKPLFIDRSLLGGEGLQVNAISSSARPEIDTILPDITKLFDNPEEENIIPVTQIKSPPLSSQERKIVLETQDSPSFLATPEMKRTFQDSTETVEFLQLKTCQPLSSQGTFFPNPTEEPFCFEFGKENQPPGKQKTYSRRQKPRGDDPPKQRVLRDRNQTEATSQDCFRQNFENKKPSLPKFNTKKTQPEVKNKRKQPRRSRRREPLPIQEVVEQPKPSLLDPNGYAFQRWMQPTTSERSNFWLRKLDRQSKQKSNVFDFPGSDSEMIRKRKQKVVHSKRRYRKNRYNTKRPSLKQGAENFKNLKKGSPKVKKPSPVGSPETVQIYKVPVGSPVLLTPSPKWNKSIRSEVLDKCSTSLELSSEEEFLETQKRDRSEEENSLTRVHLKKKVRTKTYIPGTFLPMIMQRLQKAENRARQETNEIIATMNRATNQLLNHFQRKEGAKIKSYLNVAEEASARLEDDVKDLNRRIMRFHKVILYFKAGCSISGLYQSVENRFEQIKDGIRDVEIKAGVEKKITHVTERLRNLIEEGINNSIKNEMASKRNQLMRCASILGNEFG